MSESLPRLPARSLDSHKGTFGTALLIGGSASMSGAIALAGMAALRAGTGLVRLAVPAAIQPIVASFEPCYTTAGLACDDEGRLTLRAAPRLAEMLPQATAAALGPGLGRSPELDELVRQLYSAAPLPMVIDADGLNALATPLAQRSSSAGPRVLTPHPGEFARLVGTTAKNVQQRRTEAAGELARASGAVVVLKGHGTVITDGRRLAINETGNPGMATGGTGDVLTGIITALLCQGMEAYLAARLGVYLHGLAGDLAAREKGQVGLIARDLVEYLPAAIRQLT